MSSNHGNTPAAWSAVVEGLIGFVVGSVALLQVPTQMTLLWIGIIVAVLAFPLFLVLAKLGFHASDH